MWATGMWIYSGAQGAVGMIGPLELHWPFFALLASIGISGVVALNARWVWSWYKKPIVALHKLGHDGMLILTYLDSYRWKDGGLKAKQFAIEAKRIGVRCPPPGDPMSWSSWLLDFIPLAKTASLKEAKSLLDDG